MVKIGYDAKSDAVVVEFEGDVDAPQAARALAALDRLIPKERRGFKLLSDFSAAGVMEPEVENVIRDTMRYFKNRGVKEIVRVLPDPDWDIGFAVMSREVFGPQMKARTVRTRRE